MPDRVTLHDEIAAILAESATEWMTTAEIADQVNARGQYQKRDGSRVTAYQIHGRTRNYPHLFERDGPRVRLRRGAHREATPPRLTRKAPAAPPLTDSELIDEAVEILSQPGLTHREAAVAAPRRPGIYAITVTEEGLRGLGFDETIGIIYAGKAETSLEGRDLRQHFADGQTGRSTLRRSLAALLADEFGMKPMPRNPLRPADFDRYALEPDGDSVLSAWMRAHLRLAFWLALPGTLLRPIESAVTRRLAPPLNLTDVLTPHTARIKASRRVMADLARAWVRH